MAHTIEQARRETGARDGSARYLKLLDEFVNARPSDEPSWLRRTRAEATARFHDLGFPTTRQEEWRFTGVMPIADAVFSLTGQGATTVSSADVQSLALGGAAPCELVFVNGRFAPELSQTSNVPAGMHVASIASVLSSKPALIEPHLTEPVGAEHPFTTLNTAFLHDGAFVSIPAGTVMDGWIHLVFVTWLGSPEPMSHPRTVIVAGENSQARIVESYVGPRRGRYFTNAVTDVRLGSAAIVDHYKVQREGLEAYHIGGMYVHADRRSTFSSHSIAFGGALVRNDVVAVLGGEGIDCTLNGLYTADGDRLIDNHTTIDHAMPHCGSHEIYKGILGGHARAVFNGKIIVRPDAQKTDAKQTNKALLLSDDATINTKPQLEIFANDVKCTHGAAIGQLDDEAIFYLRARGLDYEAARNLLIRAFAGDILTRVKLDTLRTDLERVLLTELPESSRRAGL